MSSSAEEKVEGLGGLLRLIGDVPARARFVGNALVSSLLSSVAIGLSFGMVGAAFLPSGPLVPFLVGSWAGNTFGLYHYYRSCKNVAMRVARNYPSILAHALWTEWGVSVPPGVVAATEERCRKNRGKVDTAAALETDPAKGDEAASLTLDQWIQIKGHKMVGFAILSVPQCEGDVQMIQRSERDSLIQSHQENVCRLAE
jgi:hypothetical protein